MPPSLTLHQTYLNPGFLRVWRVGAYSLQLVQERGGRWRVEPLSPASDEWVSKHGLRGEYRTRTDLMSLLGEAMISDPLPAQYGRNAVPLLKVRKGLYRTECARISLEHQADGSWTPTVREGWELAGPLPGANYPTLRLAALGLRNDLPYLRENRARR